MTTRPARPAAPRSVVRRVAALLPGLLVVVLVAAGCSGLDGTGDGGYVIQDGAIAQIGVEDRDPPVELFGETLEGEDLALADLRGEVVVVNVWGSWCTPCRTEAEFLVEAEAELDVPFVGVNIRDDVDSAQAFERAEGIDYPSIYDPASEALLSLGQRYAPRSPPTTLVLDRDGRIAAVVSGALTSALTLTELVEEVQAEDG